MVVQPKIPQPVRSLRLDSAAAVRAEIVRLRDGGYQRGARWNLTQICQHLSNTMRMGLEGGQNRVPWILRRTVGRWFMHGVLASGSMKAGVMTLKTLRPTAPDGPEDPAIIAECLDWIDRSQAALGPLPPHPLVDDLALEDWKRLQWIHASHHLSFLLPNEPA